MKRNREEWAKTEKRRMGRWAHREALRIMRVYRAIDEESWYAGSATPQATGRTSHGPPAPPTSVSATGSVAQARIVDHGNPAQRSQTPQDRTNDSEPIDHEVLRLRGGRGKHLGSFDLSGSSDDDVPPAAPDRPKKQRPVSSLATDRRTFRQKGREPATERLLAAPLHRATWAVAEQLWTPSSDTSPSRRGKLVSRKLCTRSAFGSSTTRASSSPSTLSRRRSQSRSARSTRTRRLARCASLRRTSKSASKRASGRARPRLSRTAGCSSCARAPASAFMAASPLTPRSGMRWPATESSSS